MLLAKITHLRMEFVSVSVYKERPKAMSDYSGLALLFSDSLLSPEYWLPYLVAHYSTLEIFFLRV